MEPDTPHQLRASDADREATVGRLRVAAMEGRLDAEELAQRVSQAYDARWCSELDGLTADVTPSPQAAPSVISAPPTFVRPVQTVNGFAVASLVLGLTWWAWVGSVLAVVLGHIALHQIRAARGRQTGKALAVSGLALGYFGMLTLLIALVSAIVPG